MAAGCMDGWRGDLPRDRDRVEVETTDSGTIFGGKGSPNTKPADSSFGSIGVCDSQSFGGPRAPDCTPVFTTSVDSTEPAKPGTLRNPSQAAQGGYGSR